MGLWQVRSLRRSALPWRHGKPLTEKLALDAGIHRRVEVLLHEALPGPITCGAVHPAILLPQDAQTWIEGDLNRALVHELEHVRRGDWAVHCLARAVCAAYWFHPLVWIAWQRLTLEAERSCDDAVLRLSEATAYADQLVGLAQRLLRAKSPLPAMANRADLAVRVEAVLDSRQRRGRAGRLSVALAGAAAAVLTLTMSPLRIVAAPQSSADDQPSRTLKFNAQVKLIMVDVMSLCPI
jgi:beta-lactamase regulating signal transducer with metallopeptidase domain